MTMKLSTREWEAISAYLDGELAPKERTRLEQRLQLEPDLRVALDDMRRTRIILRSQPRMRAPRNFALTPKMLEERGIRRPAPRAFPVFRFVTAVASVLLIFVLIGDFFSRAPVQSSYSIANAPLATQLVQREMEGLDQSSGETAGSAPAESEAALRAAGVQEQPAAEATMEVMLAAPEATQVPAPAAGAETTPTASPTEAPAAIAAAPAQPAAEEQAPEAALSKAAPTQAAELADQASQAFEPAVQPKGLSVEMFRVLEIGLALLALASGLVAFWLQRSGR